MAKKTTLTSTGPKGFSFADFDKQLSKIPGFELGSILTTNTFSEVDEWIHSGNYTLNAQISGTLFGGFANSRSIGLVGDPGTGKTFVCLNCIREAQKMGYDIIYCDTEGSVGRKEAANFGVDTDRIRYQPIRTVNDFKAFTVQVCDMVKNLKAEGKNPKIMLILDSLGMLATAKELRDALEGKQASDMGLKAKELRSLFRVITYDLTENKIPLIVTNHTTSAIGAYVPTKLSSGGDGPVFAMSTVLFFTKGQLKEGETKTGIIVTSKPNKSRFTITHPVKFHISFHRGMNPYVGLEEFVNWDVCGIQRGKIEPAKNYKGNSQNFFTHRELDVDKKTGEIKKNKDGTDKYIEEDLVFAQSETGRWCVKHLGKSVVASEFFNPEVFTMDVLKNLDEKVIKKHFQLPDHSDPEAIYLEDELVAAAETPELE